MTPQEQLLKEQLEAIGVIVRAQHFEGDSSYPTEITLRYGPIHAMGTTMELATTSFVEKLLRLVPVEKS